MKKYIYPTEAQEQEMLFKRAAYSPDWRIQDLLYAIPNGGYRNKREASALVRQGVRGGVPDICLPYPSNGYHALYIELKRQYPKGRMSPMQLLWKDRLLKAGNYHAVCYGWLHAWEEVQIYLEQPIDNM